MQRIVERKDLTIKHENFTNPRKKTGLDKETLKEFGDRLKKEDIQIPLQIIRVKNGSEDPNHFVNLVIDGQRRYLGADIAGISDIPVIDVTDAWSDGEPLVNLTPEKGADIMLAMLSVGNYREGLASWELLEIAADLRAKNKTVNEIGKAIRRDPSWVTRFLEASKEASEDLMKQWQIGKITDEAFKELAQVKKEEQKPLIKQYQKLRDEKDPGSARQLIKEASEEAKAAKEPVKGKPGPKPKIAAKRAEEKKATEKAKADGPKPPSRAAVEELASAGRGKPIVDAYVRGLVDGAKYALGLKEPRAFEKSWHKFLARLDGGSTSKKIVAKKVAKAAKKAKAKK